MMKMYFNDNYEKVGLTIPSQPQQIAILGCLGISSPTIGEYLESFQHER